MAAILRAGSAVEVGVLTAELRSLVAAGATAAVCDVSGIITTDMGVVDALARLQLSARRLGCDLTLWRESVELARLLEFVGLAEALRVELGRQPEEREQRLGVQEERELDDPSL